MFFSSKKDELVAEHDALPDNPNSLVVDNVHFVLNTQVLAPFDAQHEIAYFGMGCFWGAERLFWQQKGVVSTSVGYQGGYTGNPTYQQVCTGQTGHTETVLVVFDPAIISYDKLLEVFWENHQPTQGMRQGADRGTQYRSALYCTSKNQLALAKASAAAYKSALDKAGNDSNITTEIQLAKPFYYAENDHQQYLAKNPQGYCGIGGSGVCYPS